MRVMKNDERLIENAFISLSSFQSFASPEQAFRQSVRFLPNLNAYPYHSLKKMLRLNSHQQIPHSTVRRST